MYSLRQPLLIFLLFTVLLIGIVNCFRLNDNDQHNSNYGKTLTAHQVNKIEQILNRRSFYDPAFDDSWSNYLEKKRSLFDPAYNEWDNSFKRSDE